MNATELLESIAAAVAEGRNVDWDESERRLTDAAQRRQVHALHMIDSIARFHDAGRDDATITDGAHAVPPTEAVAWHGLRIGSELGGGAFGRVYRAHDPALRRDVALKLVPVSRFRRADAESFLREGRMLARVRHPNVVQVHGAAVEGDSAGMWMDLIDGETLEEHLRSRGPLGVGEAVSVAIEMCRGLAAVHAAGLVHRDIKTSNVMRERGGRVVVTDLGAGFDAHEEPDRALETTGTPYFMAPEVLIGQPATAVSDVYSVGVVLFRLVTSSFPVRGGSLAELVSAHNAGRRESLRDLRPDLPPALIRVIESAMAADPADRYGSAGGLQAALEAVIAGDPRPRPALSSTRRGLLSLAVAGVLALVAAAWVLTSGRGESSTFTVQAGFERSGESIRERVRVGDQLDPGDRLTLTFRASAPVYVYVLNRDDSGATYLLFPIEESEPGNPLPAGVLHRLPGRVDDVPQSWVVTESGGAEHFLIVASRKALPEFETDLAALPTPSAGAGRRYARLSESSRRRLRGVGGLAPDETAVDDDLFSRIEALGDGSSTATDVWVRRVTIGD